MSHFVGLAAGQTDRKELATESTSDGRSREEACTSDSNNLIEVAGLEALREAARELRESLPRDGIDALAISVVVAPHFGPASSVRLPLRGPPNALALQLPAARN
jgi:hypothetical protein